jgi:Mrp family chromosome partitioning ATPase
MTALVKELMSTLVRTERDVRRLLGVEPVAVMPLVDRARSIGDEVPLGELSAEYHRALLYISLWIERSCGPGALPVVVIASSQHGDGKTTLATNLAQLQAKRRRRTLLISCSERWDEASTPQVAPLDEASHTERAPYADAQPMDQSFRGYADVRLHTDLSGGEEVAQLEQMLAGARQSYDCVILDAAALGDAVEMHELFKFGDCVLFIVRSGVSTQATAQASLLPIGKYTSVPIGIVLNMIGCKSKPVRHE